MRQFKKHLRPLLLTLVVTLSLIWDLSWGPALTHTGVFMAIEYLM